MIYAQRPDALACAPIQIWNKPMNRYVKRGSKGIALLDNSGNTGKLKYVFDVADTLDGWYKPHRPFLWQMQTEHVAPVWEALDRAYRVSEIGEPTNIGDMFYGLAANLASDYYKENHQDILFATKDNMAGLSNAERGGVFLEAHVNRSDIP